MGRTNPDGSVTVSPVFAGEGTPIAIVDEEGKVIEENGGASLKEDVLLGYQVDGGYMDGRIIRSGDFAMQAGLMAQGLPTEPWYAQMVPTLFGVDVEEARNTFMMYGLQLQAWALRQVVVTVNPTKIIHTLLDGSKLEIVTGGFSFEFHPDEVPPMPKLLSGLQRLGITGREILGGLLAYFAFDLSKTNSNNAAATSQSAISGAQDAFEAGAGTAFEGVGLGAGIAAP